MLRVISVVASPKGAHGSSVLQLGDPSQGWCNAKAMQPAASVHTLSTAWKERGGPSEDHGAHLV